MKRKITIKDVSKDAGVSTATVSFVLNNTDGQRIPERTRKKVFEAAKRLGYSPNFLAKGVRTRSSKSIGVVTSYNAKFIYFLDMLNGVLKAADNIGYGVTICSHEKGVSEESSFIKYFLENRLDGLLLISSAHSEEASHELEYIELFKKNDVPFVVIYGYTMEKDVNYVNIDFNLNSFEATRHLIDKGCKRFAYIAPMEKNDADKYLPRTERDRIKGFQRALSESGKKDSSENIIFLPRDFKKNHEQVITAFSKLRDVDGIVTCWATYGMQVLNMARDLNIKIPGELRVISLDTLPFLDHTYPGLSSMRLPFYEIAMKGTEILVSQIMGKNAGPVNLNLPCILEARDSTS